MKTLFFLFSLALVAACQGGMFGPAPRLAWQDGTETHGGDVIVAAVKADAYRLIERSASDSAFWEAGPITATEVMDAISQYPVFSDTRSSQLFMLGAAPRRHVILARRAFMDPAQANLNMTKAAQQLIRQVLLEKEGSPEQQQMAQQIFQTRLGDRQFALTKPNDASDNVLSFFYFFGRRASEIGRSLSACVPYSASHLSHGKLRQTDTIAQNGQLENLSRRVPVVARHVPILDPEFGYRLDAQAVLSATGSRIEIDVTRKPPALSADVLEVHEYSHHMNLKERDRHYLFSYSALDCL